MVHDCSFCDEELESEVDLHRHWLAEHEEELSSHKQDTAERTVRKHTEKQRSYQSNERQARKTIAMIAAGIIVVVITGFLLVDTGIVAIDTERPTAPTGGPLGAPGTAHYHAAFSLTVNGQPIDFSQQRYQVVDSRAHFEGGDGTTLHYHATNVPLSYVFGTFGWEFTENQTVVAGTTFTPAETEVLVNGEPLENPATYVGQEGDVIQIRLSSK